MDTIYDTRFSWTDFEPEPEMTGDGSGDPDKHYLTIYEYGEELATIIHRASPAFPIDGPEADRKRENAERIVHALSRLIHDERKSN